jgi:hypothetical protein
MVFGIENRFIRALCFSNANLDTKLCPTCKEFGALDGIRTRNGLTSPPTVTGWDANHYTTSAWSRHRVTSFFPQSAFGKMVTRLVNRAPITQREKTIPSPTRHIPVSSRWRNLERAAGIEPAQSDWQPEALPLSYARVF